MKINIIDIVKTGSKPVSTLIICTLLMMFFEFLSWLWFKIDFLPYPMVPLGDVPFNIVEGLLTVVPFVLACKTPKRFLLILAMCLPVMIDIDHFVVARSFSLIDAISHPYRPVTHSFVIVLIFSVILSIVARSKVVGIVSFSSLCSHLLRDAASGNNFLYYPISLTTHNIDYTICVLLLCLLPVITLMCGSLVMTLKSISRKKLKCFLA